MKLQEYFPHYFPKQASELSALFGTAIFVFDTNVYLDLYRLGPVARSEVINALRECIPNSVWTPHHVALEFSKNRSALVLESSDNLEQHLKNIESGLSQFKLILGDEKLAQSIDQAIIKNTTNTINSTFQEIVDNIRIKINACATPSSEDEILTYINENIQTHPITNPNQEWYTQSAKEASDRYAKKLPPGYKDDRKDETILGIGQIHIAQKYGDYYIWKQLLEAVKVDPEVFKHVVFVTSDRKEDWWEITRGKTLGARPELKLEISSAGAETFHMYQLPRLVELLKEYAITRGKQPKISEETLAEVRDVEDFPTSRDPDSDTTPFHGLGFLNSNHFSLQRPHASSTYGFNSFRHHTIGVENWVKSSLPNFSIKQQNSFPDIIASAFIDETLFIHGFEIFFSRNPKNLSTLIVKNIDFANNWIDSHHGLLDSGVHRFSFVVVIDRNTETQESLYSSLRESLNKARQYIQNSSRLDIIAGIIKDDLFIPLPV